MESNVTDEEIEEAFNGTNFGERDHRKLLEQGVLKQAAQYRSGHTLTQIMIGLGLISRRKDDNLTVLKKGGRFLYWALKDDKNSG